MQSFRNVLIPLWFLLCIAGYFYSQQQDIPLRVAAAVLPVCLLEITLYISLGFEAVRDRCRGLGCAFSPWLAVSAVLPWLVLSVVLGTFDWRTLAILAGMAAVVSWWYVLLPKSAATDFAFLAVMAAPVVAKLFRPLYPEPLADLRLDFLGQLMWIRIGLASVLVVRGVEGVGFGFLPRASEWRIGVLHYLYFLPPGVALMLGLGFARFEPAAGFWWKAPATFVGILWVVALSEEFFFRGMLLPRLAGWFGNHAALLLTSILFGAVHLGFREFPNWEFAALAAVAGWFYGRAFLEAGSIRAAMVAHALVVTTWRSLFR